MTTPRHDPRAAVPDDVRFRTLVESSIQDIAVHRDFEFLFANRALDGASCGAVGVEGPGWTDPSTRSPADEECGWCPAREQAGPP